jgi:hypothetical protein
MVMFFAVMIFTKSISAQRYWLEIYGIKLYQNTSRNMENWSRSTFMSISKIWISLSRLSPDSRLYDTFIRSLISNFIKNPAKNLVTHTRSQKERRTDRHDPHIRHTFWFPKEHPNFMFRFHCFGRNKGSTQFRGTGIRFVTRAVLSWRVVSTSPNPPAGRPPLVGYPWLLYSQNRTLILQVALYVCETR